MLHSLSYNIMMSSNRFSIR